ncbi:MAG: hypothetical protein EOP09_18240, partial [Proteobacteria bacterium]
AVILFEESEKIYLDQLKHEIVLGLKTLYDQVKNVDIKDIHSEFGFSTDDERWSHKQMWPELTGDSLKITGVRPHLRGSVDLYWIDKQGATRIVDVKWSSKPTKYQDMLNEKKHLQIALYCAVLKNGSWPAAAYLTLPHATLRTLAQDGQAFAGAHFAPEQLSEEHPTSVLWSSIQSAWAWRWAQFNAGYVDITTEKTPDFDDQIPILRIPEDLSFQMKGAVPDYDYLKLLTGTGRKAG